MRGFKRKKIRIKEAVFLISLLGIFGIFFPIYGDEEIRPILSSFSENNFFVSSGNTLLSFESPLKPRIKIIKRIRVFVTGYSSSIDETDDTPEITASGNRVRDGICANNLLPFHTKIRLPELFGNKIFSVEDRMSPDKSLYHVDIWFPTKEEALKFGAKLTYLEIIKEE